MAYLVSGMMSNFQLYPGHLPIMLGESWSYFSFYFNRQSSCFGLMFRFLSYFMGCNSSDDLVAETLKCCSGLSHFSGSTWAPVKSLLVLPEGVEGASLGLLVLLGGGGACWTWKTENNVALGLFSGHLVLLGFAVCPCQCCYGGKPLLGHLLPLGGGQQPWSLRWYQPLGGSLGDTGPTGATGTGRGALLPSPGEGTVPPACAPLLLMRLQEGQDYRHDI